MYIVSIPHYPIIVKRDLRSAENRRNKSWKLTLGSLFDGSGGFPLAAEMCGITPVWASEIDPFCVQVTSKRFPNMKHLGDITKINGAEIPPVNIITFGSPCQDLSVAGNRAGLDRSRSSLFLETIRIF
ncbi:MAG: DNA cytosine methyltransferase [Oscillospiraceae bacterium]|nr:DNA cytosine methyltransferase [Oscillospiraceae bacterium]